MRWWWWHWHAAVRRWRKWWWWRWCKKNSSMFMKNGWEVEWERKGEWEWTFHVFDDIKVYSRARWRHHHTFAAGTSLFPLYFVIPLLPSPQSINHGTFFFQRTSCSRYAWHLEHFRFFLSQLVAHSASPLCHVVFFMLAIYKKSFKCVSYRRWWLMMMSKYGMTHVHVFFTSSLFMHQR